MEAGGHGGGWTRGQQAAHRAWWLLLLAGAATFAAYFAAAGHWKLQYSLFGGATLASAVAVTAGIRLRRPPAPGGWWLLCAGLWFWVGGAAAWGAYHVVLARPVPLPSAADAIFALAYLSQAAGLMLIARARDDGSDRRGWLDALVVAIGLGALSWVTLISPTAHDESLDVVQRVVSVSYPLLDIVLLGLLVRLLYDSAPRPAPYWLLAGGVATLVAADVFWSISVLQGTFADGSPLYAFWMIYLLGWGASALHPAMGELTAPGSGGATLGRKRLATLALAALLPPVIIAIPGVASEDTTLLAIVTALLFAIVLLRLSGLMVDVGEHRRVAERLRASEERFRRVFERAPLGMALVSADGRYRQTNRALQRMLGYSEREMAGMGPLDNTHPEDRDHSAEDMRWLYEGQSEVYEREKRFVTRDGRPVWTSVTMARIGGDEGPPNGIKVIADITERKQIERMKDELVSVVSHELRTPLTSIRGALGLLAGGAMGEMTDSGRRMVGIAAANADRLVRLINDILDVERMQSGQIAMHPAPVESGALIASAVQEMAAMASEAGVALAPAESAALVWADADRVVQTLTNLISNAIKFSSPDSQVRISAERSGDEVRFSVADRGRGIPPESLPTIFDRFTQVDASDSREKGGTGLGLAICKMITEQHGGRIWADSEPGRGSTFHFTLPAAGEEAPVDAVPGNGALATVLVVEDDPDLVLVLRDMLAGHGLNAAQAGTAPEAIDLSRTLRPDVVVVDIGLPEGDGFEVVDALRDDPDLEAVPVVVYTARDLSDEDERRLDRQGAVVFTKGRVTPEEFEAYLLGVVEATLRPPS